MGGVMRGGGGEERESAEGLVGDGMWPGGASAGAEDLREVLCKPSAQTSRDDIELMLNYIGL
jgi:hypothetical protein